MIPIYTLFRDGEALMPEVAKAMINQSFQCCMIPITSKGSSKYSENNRRLNLLRALDLNKSDVFIFMDSDVVLHKDAIKELLEYEYNHNRAIATFTTKGEKVETCSYIPHALTCLRGEMIYAFKFYLENIELTGDNKEDCIICKFLQSNLDDCITLENSNIKEIKRLDLLTQTNYNALEVVS